MDRKKDFYNELKDEEIIVYDASKFGTAEKLNVFGKWHDIKNPQYIKITNQKK